MIVHGVGWARFVHLSTDAGVASTFGWLWPQVTSLSPLCSQEHRGAGIGCLSAGVHQGSAAAFSPRQHAVRRERPPGRFGHGAIRRRRWRRRVVGDGGGAGPSGWGVAETRPDLGVGRGQRLAVGLPRREGRARSLLERAGACVLEEQHCGFWETPRGQISEQRHYRLGVPLS